MENYLAVNAVNGQRIAEEDAQLSCGMAGEEHAILRSFLEARPEYPEVFFDEIDTRYGSFDVYVQSALPLDAGQRQALEELMDREAPART